MTTPSRTRNLNVRLTDEEYKQWTAQAKELGFAGTSEFVRSAVATYATSTPTDAVVTDLKHQIERAQAVLRAAESKED